MSGIKTLDENKIMDDETNVILEDDLSQHFSGIIKDLSGFKTQITSIQSQIKNLEKYIKKKFKNLHKQVEKNKQKGNKKPSGFAKPTKVSEELCEFLNKDKATEMARTEVTQFIIKYIQDNNLQNPDNKKIINPDNKLKKLLEIKETDELNYFNIQKYMNKHFNNIKEAL
tara:strand:+ start:1855 stop:2364 length:510 start_codon:yes stop_codon:yes gene_type:complete